MIYTHKKISRCFPLQKRWADLVYQTSVNMRQTRTRLLKMGEWCANALLIALTIMLLYPTGENFLAFMDFSTSSTVITTEHLITVFNSTDMITIHTIKGIIKLLLWDKAQHLFSFGLCYFLFVTSRIHYYCSSRPLRFNNREYTHYVLLTTVWFCIYACVTEYLQKYVPLRSFSWLDMTANVIGVLIGFTVVMITIRIVTTSLQ